MEVECCSTGMCASIVCSAVCEDNCGPEVLLAPSIGKSGMLCAGFVRPPVDVYLQLRQPVDLKAVELKLRWQRQLVTGVVLWTSDQSLDTDQVNSSTSSPTIDLTSSPITAPTSPTSTASRVSSLRNRPNSYSCRGKPTSRCSTSRTPHISTGDISASSSSSYHWQSKSSTSSASTTEANTRCQLLRSRHWRKAGVFMYDSHQHGTANHHHHSQQQQQPTDLAQWHGSVRFSTPAFRCRWAGDNCDASMTNAPLYSGPATHNVRALRISLVRVLGASAVCLSGLSVRAMSRSASIGSSSSITTTSNTKQALDSSSSAGYYGSSSSSLLSSNESGVTPSDNGDRHASQQQRQYVTVDDRNATPLSLKPPEDLLDALTCELLEVPMLLPSGYLVDRSTVARCANLDASLGRTERDPFTGVPFTNTYRPVSAPVSLKSRLDHFLFELETAAAGRPGPVEGVFSRPGRTVGSVVVPLDQQRDSRSRCAVSSVVLDASVENYDHQVACLASGSSEHGPAESGVGLAKDQTSVRQHISTGMAASTSTLSSSSSPVPPSLNQCIRSTLAGLTSFRHDSCLSHARIDQCLCLPPDAIDNPHIPHPLYRLRHCGHVICRRCLGAGTRQCHVCGDRFTRQSVTRVHLVS